MAGDCVDACGVGPCCGVRGPMSPGPAAAVMAFGCCAGLWWSASCPVCLVTLGDHPVGVCDAVSSAGRFWPARLLSSMMGGGELRDGGGVWCAFFLFLFASKKNQGQ